MFLHEFWADKTRYLLQGKYGAMITLSIRATDLIRPFLDLKLHIGTHALNKKNKRINEKQRIINISLSSFMMQFASHRNLTYIFTVGTTAALNPERFREGGVDETQFTEYSADRLL